MKGLTVSQVSKLAGVSVRTLHHYDEIGLLSPSERSGAGYRLYTDAELQRLQQVLFFRELGFPLEEIARILRDPAFDLHAALLLQRQLLEERASRTQALIRAVDATLRSLEEGTTMTNEERFEAFTAEAEQRWGDTDAFKESKKRTGRYGKQDWQVIQAEADAILKALGEAFDAGVKPTDARAMDLVERHRQHISRWFYPCSHELQRGLGELYVQDPRFSAYYDGQRPGLAQYVRDAIVANAERASA